jgi:hypothetical protein
MKPFSFLLPSLLLALIVTTLVVVSCNKNNNAKPTLSLESISNPVLVNDSMRVLFKFSGGGAITNGYLWSIRNRINQLQVTNQSGGDTVQFNLPSFTGNSGEIYLSFPWQGYLNETATQNDTDIFKFYVQNAADSTTSDTVTTGKIVVLYQ